MEGNRHPRREGSAGETASPQRDGLQDAGSSEKHTKWTILLLSHDSPMV